MKAKNLWIRIGWTVAGLALAAGCTDMSAGPTTDTSTLQCMDAIRCVEVRAGEPIEIAAMVVLSGSTAFLGQDQVGAIEIALHDFGDILGHDIVLQKEDALCSAEGGQTAAQRIAANPAVVGILGTACSSAATAALPIVSEAGLSMIAASTTSPTLTEPERTAGGVWQPGYYRTAHNDLFLGRMTAEFAYRELGARSLATIHDGSPYANKMQEVVVTVFQELGGIVTHQGAVNVGDTDMRSLLTEIASTAPDILFFPIFQPEGNLVAVQAREVPGLENTTLMGAAALFSKDFPVNTGQAAIGMYLPGPLVQNAAYDALLAQWEDLHGGSPPAGYHAHMYDAATLLLHAVASVAQTDAQDNLLIGLQAIRTHLNGVADFDGITGRLTCSPTGDCATGEALAMYRIDAEHVDGIWPPVAVYRP